MSWYLRFLSPTQLQSCLFRKFPVWEVDYLDLRDQLFQESPRPKSILLIDDRGSFCKCLERSESGALLHPLISSQFCHLSTLVVDFSNYVQQLQSISSVRLLIVKKYYQSWSMWIQLHYTTFLRSMHLRSICQGRITYSASLG